MKGSELIRITRAELDDEHPKFKWQTPELLDFMIDAQNEACRRGRLLVDSLTDKICHISLAANEMHYKLDRRIIFIRRVKLSDYNLPLGKMRLRDIDVARPGWESHIGHVRHWLTGYSNGYLTFYKAPDASLYTTLPSVRLTVVRLPLVDAKLDAELEIHERHQRSLRHWMKFRAYSKEDGDTYDPNKAAAALTMFEQEFGPASPAFVEEFIDEQYNYEDDQGLY